MATQTKPEIVLYDLACTKDVCFSPVVWRIRLMLNYKHVPYKTIFLELHEIEPTLKGLGVAPYTTESRSRYNYTVPAIHHLPTNTLIMDSAPISQFVESTYPTPPVPLDSELGQKIEAQAYASVGDALRSSMLPREVLIFSPSAQAYFRRTREAQLGHPLEDLLDAQKEDKRWSDADEGVRAVDRLMSTHAADGPFVLGATPSYADFFVVGVMQFARVVDEGSFQRFARYPAFARVYEACLPFMERRD